MLSQSKRRLIDRLKRPRSRTREGLALVEGPRVAAEALRTTTEVVWGVVGEAWAGTEAGEQLSTLARDRGVALESLPDEVVAGLGDTETPQPVLLVVRPPESRVGSGAAPGRYLYLDGVQDPGNVGTLIRSAWAFGLSGVFPGKGTADPWSAKVIRSSAGGVFHVPFFDAAPDAPASGPDAGWPGPVLYAEARQDAAAGQGVGEVGPTWVLAVGNEGRGVSPGVRALGRPVSLAMRPGVDSLNAAVAGSILMYVLTHPGTLTHGGPGPPHP